MVSITRFSMLAFNSRRSPSTGGEMRALREREVLARTGLSRTQLRRLIAKRAFPAPVKLSERCSAWDSRAVDAWLAAKFAASQDNKHPSRQ